MRLNSMTGFGRSRKETGGREMTVEVKSVNHRFLDIACRMPRSVSYLEETARSIISGQLVRGHIDVYVAYQNNRDDTKEIILDLPLASAYKTAFNQLREELKLDSSITIEDYIQIPGIIKVVEKEDDQAAIKSLFEETLSEALLQLTEMRKLEGMSLSRDLLLKLNRIEVLKEQIEKLAPSVIASYRTRLKARLTDLLAGNIDENRFETEVAIFADRCAIDEELVRLKSHIQQMRVLLDGDEAAGRKMDFLVQELNREINTIGSKASDGEIAKYVVEAKGEIEKFREQVQNLE